MEEGEADASPLEKLRAAIRGGSWGKGAIFFQVEGVQEGGVAPTCCRVTRMWELV